jgi:hypothetical protein
VLDLTKLTEPETLRVYTFPGGETVKLTNVTHFLARPSGTHRLMTADGRLHIVPVGWIHIEIEAKAFSL